MGEWNQIEVLFEELREKDPQARADALLRFKEDDPIRRRVAQLLAAHDSPSDFLEAGSAGLLSSLREAGAQELCGHEVGPYRIEEYLSSGGMAHVYRATLLREGARRRVALKVLQGSGRASGRLGHFQWERQALAKLEHEYIVAFLDAGSLPDGRPYLVMEYVEGCCLTDWCANKSERTKLELLLQILAAVQYAHDQFIVHRDLKPSNVLVTDRGVPKLLDFGVASALGVEHGSEAQGLALTPVYASPEQLQGSAATPASDVWSLTLVMHEVLTGALPAQADDAARRQLAPDLAAILRKGLEQDPAERYPRPDALAADLTRYLAGRPVLARRTTALHRGKLLLKRNRWFTAGLAALVLGLVMAWVGADLGRRRALREASAGWGAHADARQALHAYEDWILQLAQHDPELRKETIAYLEQLMAECLTGRAEPEVLVHLLLARLFQLDGEPGRAREHAQRAGELARVARGVGPREENLAQLLQAELAGQSSIDAQRD